ncbi:hypothetical protein [Arenimonas malthae]|uniref:hypothetical protein n=1 Tax=Arenimonas malthae TaxID=354197 RepID=UPI0012EC30F0|nr:hypothetical protein [Arenimonas malthae]
MSLPELAEKSIYVARTMSGLHEKWADGSTALSRGSAVKLEKVAPGTLEVFDLPLLPLLAQRPLSEGEIFTLLLPYRRAQKAGGHSELLPWQFPDEQERIRYKDFVPIMSVTDTENLFLYGTPHSFSALLGIARLAESKGDVMLHLRAFQGIYRSLPFILRAPWFHQNRSELIELLHSIRCRMHLSAALFDVDWDVISRQETDPTITLCRWRRPRCSVTGRFVDLEDPILEAEIVPGLEVKRRRLVAARKKEKRGRSGA